MILEAENISSSHQNFRILNQVDVSVKKGELLIIIGPNGAGKSTLLNFLANEDTAHDDKIYFQNKKFKEWNNYDLAHYKAKFSQEYNSDIGLLVKDIVLMGRYPYFDAVPHKEDLMAMEQAMETTEVFHLQHRNYNSLSGGEKQRVHLARVLAQLRNSNAAKLAFFDEPLNNLDVRHQYQVLEAIRQFTNQGNSAILVLHDLNLAAEFADNLLLLKRGNVAAHGTPDFIFSEEIISKAYNFPCAVCKNPLTHNPMIIFKNRIKSKAFSF